MFENLTDKLTHAFKNIRSKGKLTETDINDTMRHIRLALLEADVALPVVREFITKIKTRCTGLEVSAALHPAQQIVKIVNEELINILGGENSGLRFSKTPPTVIMLAGLQGAGKTTLAGKLGLWLKNQQHTPILVACDLQRPGAVQQLQTVGEQAGVPVFAPHPGTSTQQENTNNPVGEVGNPVEVARTALEYARTKQHDVVIIDTAGRLGVDEILMQQAADIKTAVQPDNVLFVLDAMVGQDAVNTALAFKKGVDFTGVALTKLDGDARGGGALSVKQITGVPIIFSSTGEKIEDLSLFHPDRVASRILDMGDVLTLIEQAEKVFDEQKAQAAAEKISSGKLNLVDFLNQLKMVRSLGPISNLLGMLPGAGQMKTAINQLDEKQLDRMEAIINGMTPAERAEPKIINASRKIRIAKGSGVSVGEVNQLVEKFEQARKMMSNMTNRFGFPGGKMKTKLDKKMKGKKSGRHSIFAPSTNSNAVDNQIFNSAKNLPDLSKMPKGLNDLPPALKNLDFNNFDLNQFMNRNNPKDPSMRKRGKRK